MKILILTSLLLTAFLISDAQLSLKLELFSTGYTKPVDIQNSGDSRLFIVERTGKIIICDSDGTRRNRAFLDLTSKVACCNERGVLGLAFDPAYKTNGYFYVYYINLAGNTQLSRFNVIPGSRTQADINSEKPLLTIAQPYLTHKGGCIHFGPDGYLYIATGDGGSSGDTLNNAQNKQSLLGKMLRIDVHHGEPYAIPDNNPFKDSAAYRPEIWALGLRNPWRWSFDASNGSMYIADVGQDTWEELNVQKAGIGGQNYGWRCYEGNHTYNTDSCTVPVTVTFPVYEYAHNDISNYCAIIGGYVYRGSKYPNLKGKYIFNDYCNGIFTAYYIQKGKTQTQVLLDAEDNAYVAYGEDRKRELYVANINGSIYRVTDASASTTLNAGIRSFDLFTITPNPSKGRFYIDCKSVNDEALTITVSSSIGTVYYRATKKISSGTNNFSIDVKAPAGTYFIRISTASGESCTRQLKIE